jgi:hypothetical protein
MNVYAEISSATKLPYKAGDVQAYLAKLIGKVNDLTEKEWEDLEEPTQVWCNDASVAVDNDRKIPAPEGLKAKAGNDDEADADTEEEAPKTKRVKAKANGKAGKHTAAKPAKKAKAVVADDDDEAETEDEDEAPAKPAKGKGKPTPKAMKPAKKAKGAKKGGGIGGKRARLFTDDQQIVVLSKENPKREGSDAHGRFELYTRGKKGMTVKQALAAGVSSGDLKWDSDKGFIKIS